jgi:hypothetical protein
VRRGVKINSTQHAPRRAKGEGRGGRQHDCCYFCLAPRGSFAAGPDHTHPQCALSLLQCLHHCGWFPKTLLESSLVPTTLTAPLGLTTHPQCALSLLQCLHHCGWFPKTLLESSLVPTTLTAPLGLTTHPKCALSLLQCLHHCGWFPKALLESSLVPTTLFLYAITKGASLRCSVQKQPS